MSVFSGGLAIVVLGAWCLVVAGAAQGETLLHERIDALLDAARTGPAPAASDDGAFLRRLHLDLWGVIPTAAEVTAFLDDADPEKRVKAIDRLLDDPRFMRRMTIVLDRMLMERRGQKHVKAEEWQEWLYEQVAANRPLNELMADLLAADGADDKQRPAATFFLDREGETHLLTRDVGRIYLGFDLQCAQCHDHPVIADYYQQDYYGLQAFLNRSSVFTDPKSKQTLVAEKAEGDTTFVSVFIDGEKYSAAPHLPGETPIDEPGFEKGEEYLVKPAKNVRPVPKHSRREALARQFAEGKSPQFTRNLANRLWAWMFGRGLVDPVDLHHGENPPTHPELLETLADELAAMQFDLRAFLREIALSRAYQQSHRMPEGLLDSAPQAEQLLADAEAEVAKAEAEIQELVDASLQLREKASAAETALAALDEKTKQAETALAEGEEKLAAANAARDEAMKKAAAKAEAAGEVARLAADARKLADKLKEDAVVGEAAEKLLARSEALAAESVQAEEEAEQLTAKAQEADQNLAEKKAGVDRLSAERSAASEMLRSLQGERQAGSDRQQHARRAVLQAQAKVKDAQILRDYALAAAGGPESEEAAAARTKLTGRWSERAFIARLRPLDPEQFAFSTLQAAGILEARWTAERKKQEQKDDQQPEATLAAVEKSVFNQSQGDMKAFVSILSHGEGPAAHDYEATVDEALFLANGGQVAGWLKPGGGNLAQRLGELEAPAALAAELYLSVLSRRPGEEEKAVVAEFLQERSEEEHAAAIQEIIWGLLTSAEFRFNH